MIGKYFSFLVFIFILTNSLSVSSQDKIMKIKEGKIEVKLLEVSANEVKYKMHDYLDGPVIILSTNEILYVEYANGKIQYFSSPASESRKDLLSLNLLSFVFVSVEGSYEHIFNENKYGIKTTAYFDFSSGHSIMGLKLDYKRYIHPEKKVFIYYGSGIQLTSILYSRDRYSSLGQSGFLAVSFHPSKSIVLSLELGGGIGYFFTSRYKYFSDYRTNPFYYPRYGIHLSWLF